jgi:hypothetical protein
MKKVIVGSFQRSGTHFLINNMSSNFEDIAEGWVDIVRKERDEWVKNVNALNHQDKIRQQLLEQYYPSADRRCLKTHYQIYFLEQSLREILKRYDILYVVRDPRDTMVACFHYYNRTNFERMIKSDNISRFLRQELWNSPSENQPFSYSLVKPRHIVDKWHKHVLSWLQYKDRGVVFVKFSELKRNHLATLQQIARQTSQRLKPLVREIDVSDSRFRPDYHDDSVPRGQIGVWRNFLSNSDVKFIDNWISADAKNISYDEC